MMYVHHSSHDIITPVTECILWCIFIVHCKTLPLELFLVLIDLKLVSKCSDLKIAAHIMAKLPI